MRKSKYLAVGLSVLLALTAVCIVAFALQNGENVAYVSITESTNAQTPDIFTLNFNVKSNLLRTAQFVFSYDNTVILPCSADGATLEIASAEQSDKIACFTPHGEFNLLSPEYIVNGTLTTVNLTASTEADGVRCENGELVCSFSYKLAQGKSKTASSFRLERAEYSDSALSLVFPTQSTASPIKLDNASKILYLSSDNESGAILTELSFDYASGESSVEGKLITVRADGDTPNQHAESGYLNLAKLDIYSSSDKQTLIRSIELESRDTAVGSVPFSIALPPDTYYCEITKNGYLPYTTELNLTPLGVNLGDIALIPGDITGSYTDSHGDGVVDIDDFLRVLRGFSSMADEKTLTRIDINEDGVLTVEDISYVKSSLSQQ